MIALTNSEKAHFLTALRELRGRVPDAIKRAAVDEVAVLAARTLDDPAYDATFALEYTRYERLRTLDLEEIMITRAEKGSISAADSTFRRKYIEGRVRARKPPEPKAVRIARKKPEPEKPDPALVGEARMSHLLQGREEPS